jgi:Kae1-associated kinase Bud32
MQEIDDHLRSSRTKEEAKLMIFARSIGVNVPFIYDIDISNSILTMEFLHGTRMKDLLDTLTDKQRKQLCETIGGSIAQLHNNEIIHGDITTSNLMVIDDQVYFIDFGLGSFSSEDEAKAVDLHVLMEAFTSTHSQYPDCFTHVWTGYQQVYQGDSHAVFQTIQEIIKRGRYR